MIAPRAQHGRLVPPGGIDHHVRDMTATLSADITLRDAQEHLQKHDQWIPIDGDAGTTLGHLVETNSTGPLRLGYGAWRDLLLGCQFENGRSELITAGGRTVKNVAGYDLTKFMVGQHGIFGKLITITTRTYARPNAAVTASFAPDYSQFTTLLATTCRPHWAVLRRDALTCGYLGDVPSADFYEAELPKHKPRQIKRHSLVEDAATRASLWPARNMRAAVPPASISRFVDDANLLDWSADAAFGIVLSRIDLKDSARITRAAEALGGSATFYDAAGRPLNLAGHQSVRPILDRVKHAFDPDNALAPLPRGLP